MILTGQPATRALYTPDQRRRRDASPWTLVQGVLAPLQFLIFLTSLVLVLHALATGHGTEAALVSVLVKSAALLAIMVTGAFWERDIYGCFLFAPAFFWEDMVSLLVIALHAACVACLLGGWLSSAASLSLGLVAYAAYLINAAQFVLKLRAARRSPAALVGAAA